MSGGANKGDFGTLIAYEVACTYYSFAARGAQRRNDFTGIDRGVT